MRLAITGADGFVGRAVVRRLRQLGAADDLLLADRQFSHRHVHGQLTGDMLDPAVLAAATRDCDAMLHLAALPGGASEQDPAASRAVNLDLPLRLIEAMSGRRLIIAGSIAVFGAAPRGPVDDETVPRPDSVYGTHKRMVELAFADAVRRGAIRGAVLRLPGIVARPAAASGFGSAFLSDVFRAAIDGERIVLPVAANATSWIASAQMCAHNLVAALLGDMTEAEAVTLPALRVRMDELVSLLRRDYAGFIADYQELPTIRQMFGSYPALITARADRLGLAADPSLEALVHSAIIDLKHNRETQSP